MTTVVTGWSPSGWKQYGKNFLETFHRFWPIEYDLRIYVEKFHEHPLLTQDSQGRLIMQIELGEIIGCNEFIDEYRDDIRANGKLVQPNWKEGCKTKGYNFRFDAWKFCRQGFIPYHAGLELNVGLLCWLDGDVTTFAKVPNNFLENILPPDQHIAYLGRPPKHSEIGFQLYRVPEALPVLKTFSDLYDKRLVFDLKEWHSAYCFDMAVKSNLVRAMNMTPNGSGNVWQQSPLAKFSDHLKGKRKGAIR